MELEIYIHIPFCVRKCAYCDFLSAPAPADRQRAYIDALEEEITRFKPKEKYKVSTVYFGGGTPSIVPAQWVREILELLRSSFSFAETCEISLECNPGTADASKLEIYRNAGINRLSFGLQSACNRELKLLGRIHTWEEFLATWQEARRAGFTNLNVDLMSALPGQTIKSWTETLERVLALQPEHISAYSLIIEEGTPFFEKYGKDAARRDAGETPKFLPSEEEEREMYHLTQGILADAGLYRYEISNYARTGMECRHNIGYWTGAEYAGFGLGAASLLDGIRSSNTTDLQDYLSGSFVSGTREILHIQEQMEEFMFLGLRLTKGVSSKEFSVRFHRSLESVYGNVIRRMISQKLLTYKKEERLALTEKGMDISNYVMAEFLL